MKPLVAASILVLTGTGASLAATPFDGSWTVSQVCPPTGQDVQGYSWVYGATVRDGVFSGAHAPSGPQDGSLRLSGRIGADGQAVLTATGRTGRSEYAVGHVPQGYPVRYSVSARFSASNGSGRRTQQRSCDFSFTKS